MIRDRLRLSLTVGGIVACAAAAVARAETAAPAFAVAAIKPSGPASGTGMSIKFLPGGTLVARNATVRVLIKIAYDLNDDQLSGGPAWTAFKRFDIDAKPDSPSGGDGQGMTAQQSQHYNQLLLQGLLGDRFGLKLRSETREISLYALVVQKSGAKLTRSLSADSQAHVIAHMGAIHGVTATADDIAPEVGDKVGRPVENRTGLDGRYDFKLDWTPDSSLGPAMSNTAGAASDAGDSGVDLFTAVQQQLGLKLEQRKSSAPCKVIESVEEPSQN
jgi:uncharacterized protein (TIGR03435 family)